MAEDLKIIVGEPKELKYKSLLPQIEALVSYETDYIANLGNIAAALKEQFNWLWIGFYLVKDQELVLGPFQGPVACTRIQKGKGVCGASWAKAKTIIVPDVDAFPGHIACSSAAKSEIVIPIIRDEIVIAVLDVDSELPDHFDEVDALYLEELVTFING
jgi:L-methionine (R)-S-oxide reductase